MVGVYEKALTIFDNAKNTVLDALFSSHKEGVYPAPPEGMRFKLLDERKGRTNSVKIGYGEEAITLYVTSGEFTDGNIGEVFLSANKQGSLVSGLLDTVATLTSLCLQYGVPLSKIIDKFKYTRFEPSGLVNKSGIRQATSLIDYVGKWLEITYGQDSEVAVGAGVVEIDERGDLGVEDHSDSDTVFAHRVTD